MMVISQIEISSKEEILEALQDVMDPEIPVLSVVDLGIVGDIELNGDEATVKIIPTFTACPAIQVMQNAIKEKVLSLGFSKVEVKKDTSIPWDSDRITESGKQKLQQFGLG